MAYGSGKPNGSAGGSNGHAQTSDADSSSSPPPHTLIGASQYDPSQFIVAPADAKGVSYRLTFRVPPDMDKGIEQVLASNRFPFTTKGDVLRWAAHHALKALNQMEEGVTSVTKRVDLLTSILNEESAHSEFMAVFDHLEVGVGKYLSDNAPQQALRVLAMAKHQFESMPAGHWRDRYLLELTKRFSHVAGLDQSQTGLKLL